MRRQTKVYLGLVQERSLCMTPPPQVLEQSDHWDQPDHWPLTALGPCSPYLTHCPLRHHCRKGNEKEEKRMRHRNSFLIRTWVPSQACCLGFLVWTNAQHHTWTPGLCSDSQNTHTRPTQATQSQTLHSHTSPPLSLPKYHFTICELNLSILPAVSAQNVSAGTCMCGLQVCTL